MRQLRPQVKAYIAAVVLVGTATVAGLLVRAGLPSLYYLPLLLLFLAGATLTEYYTVRLAKSYMTLTAAVYFAAILLLGPGYAAILTALGSVLADYVLRRPPTAWYKVLFNAGMYAAAGGLSGLFYLRLADANGVMLDSLPDFLGVGGAALLFAGLNTGLTAVVVALHEGISAWYVWKKDVRAVFPQYMAMLPIGIGFAVLWDYRPWTTVLFLLPLIVIYYSFRSTMELRRQTEEALLALADILDARDRYTANHSLRVGNLAEKIARKLGLPEDQVELVQSAGRLHDLGKVGVNDEVLLKPGRLSPEQRMEMQGHSAMGATILGYFPLFRGGANLIRYHHERYDGTGYPSGLLGERIPLGARIILVADAYEAMITDRPYRQALSSEAALDRLRSGAGTQFDPVVVGALIKILAEEAVQRGKIVPFERAV